MFGEGGLQEKKAMEEAKKIIKDSIIDSIDYFWQSTSSTLNIKSRNIRREKKFIWNDTKD